MKVIVKKYNPQWKTDFEQIKSEIISALGELALSVEHVGSTSVEGMSAKPIIDIDVVISSNAVLPAVIEKLSSIGYIHEGNLGIEGREAFKYENKPHLQEHHLYVCPENSPELFRHITFRNYLRSHPEAAAEYSSVKEEAARLYPDDIEKYIQYKSPCIEQFYALCGLSN